MDRGSLPASDSKIVSDSGTGRAVLIRLNSVATGGTSTGSIEYLAICTSIFSGRYQFPVLKRGYQYMTFLTAETQRTQRFIFIGLIFEKEKSDQTISLRQVKGPMILISIYGC
jgi:hypothetical protein